MPEYSYKCECGKLTERFEFMSGSHKRCKCECGETAYRHYTVPALKTDTSFCMTGVRDSRLDNEVIEGRKHFKRKVEEKGYMEISEADYEGSKRKRSLAEIY